MSAERLARQSAILHSGYWVMSGYCLYYLWSENNNRVGDRLMSMGVHYFARSNIVHGTFAGDGRF